MKEKVKGPLIIQTLAELLIKNIDKVPLTDLYLAFPVLKSKHCPNSFQQLIRSHIIKNHERTRELVNSAVYSVNTLLLLGEDMQSNMVKGLITWIEKQRLEDGGWHWRPKNEMLGEAESEVWITLVVYDLLKRSSEDQSYLKSIRGYLCRSLEKGPNKEVQGWSRLAYIRTALCISKDPHLEPLIKKGAQEYVSKAIEELKDRQLPNGGWAGSEKTKRGGMFQTVLVLDTLVDAGLDFQDNSVKKGFTFVTQRIDKLLHAKCGGVLIQALSIFADTLLKLGLTE